MHVNYTETDDEDIVAPKAKQRKQIGKHHTYIDWQIIFMIQFKISY